MTFLILKNNKKEYFGVYKNNKIYLESNPDIIYDKTWKYSRFLKENKCQVEYLALYCKEKELMQVCPESLKESCLFYYRRLKQFLTAATEAKINLNEVCLYDLVPNDFLLEFCEIKCKIIDYISSVYQKPEQYEFYLEIEKILEDIRNRKLNLDFSYLKDKLDNIEITNFLKKEKIIDFNQFGSKTRKIND